MMEIDEYQEDHAKKPKRKLEKHLELELDEDYVLDLKSKW